jgi:hypothetical protein
MQDRGLRKRWVEGGDQVGYAVFDIMVDHRINVMNLGLLQRKAILGELLDPCPDNVLVVGYFDSDITACSTRRWSRVRQVRGWRSLQVCTGH